MKNNATAVWTGSGKEGKGMLGTRSKVLNNTPYSYVSRFEGNGETNPEELIAAAHAGCFAMKLSFLLDAAGFSDKTLQVSCETDFVAGQLKSSTLSVQAQIPGISNEAFQEQLQEAARNCPVSLLLNTEIKAFGTLA